MSDQIKLTLPDGAVIEVPRGTTALAAAEQKGSRLAQAAVAAKVDGRLVDLSRPLEADADFAVLTFDTEEGKRVYWHSAAHIMADAVVQLFPEAKPTIGPAIADGFYYDFDVDRPFTDEDLRAIEAKMQEIIDADTPFVRREVSRDEAVGVFERKQNAYKLELIDEIPDPVVSLYEHNGFVDLALGRTCQHGAHPQRQVAIGRRRLLAGHGDQQDAERIYGTAYPKAEQPRSTAADRRSRAT